MSEVTGKQVFAWFAGGFGLIIAVNVYMAVQAVRTFPGMEVANSYVASQEFDAERTAQLALGWQVQAGYEAGEIVIGVADAAGAPVVPATVKAVVGRSTERTDDHDLAFTFGSGTMRAKADLGPGYWVVWLEMTAEDGTAFRQRLKLVVR